MFDKHDIELKYNKKNRLYTHNFPEDKEKSKKLCVAMIELWEKMSCERYEIEKAEQTIETLK
jgi:hypothetical protein